jgi:fluoride ion exporter CrcB/FEX
MILAQTHSETILNERFQATMIADEPCGAQANLFDAFPVLTEARRKTIVTAMYLSIAAILGTFLRIAMAQLFGDACANPGTVGWLKASSPLCVTKDGSSEREGGIVFADLPANLLGSFLMGMMQGGMDLDLPVYVPVAWVLPSSFFQKWDIVHTAIKTGFCGSLTTFSSWNSEMVVMAFGTGDVSKTSQVISAFFGYIVGMETALGSFVFGKTMAIFIHRWASPKDAEEMDSYVVKSEQGVYINHVIPEFERRYLPELNVQHEYHTVTGVEYLDRWRDSTREARRVGHEHLSTLCEIENAMLIKGEPFSKQAEQVAVDQDWDLGAIAEWIKCNPRPVPQSEDPSKVSVFFSVTVSSLIFGTVLFALLFGLYYVNGEHAYQVTYRTMIYSACFSPFGVLLRWQLSALNGKLRNIPWVPAGTLLCNVAGSIISIMTIAFELKIGPTGFWLDGTLRALRVGFSGCLTTVSTFVTEVSNLMKSKPRHYRAYLYILMSLGTSGLLASAVYALIVYG